MTSNDKHKLHQDVTSCLSDQIVIRVIQMRNLMGWENSAMRTALDSVKDLWSALKLGLQQIHFAQTAGYKPELAFTASVY